jgi:hypothetical protein
VILQHDSRTCTRFSHRDENPDVLLQQSGSGLAQLCMWQLALGYSLRELEVQVCDHIYHTRDTERYVCVGRIVCGTCEVACLRTGARLCCFVIVLFILKTERRWRGSERNRGSVPETGHR